MPARFDLEEARALLGLSEARLRERLDVENGQVQEDVRYERLEGVTQLYNPEAFAGRVYIRGGRVEMIYVPNGPALADASLNDLRRGLRSKPKELRSRAGKEFTHVVYPEDGLAFSVADDDLRFVEVFPPRSFQDYKAQIYRDPGAFVR